MKHSIIFQRLESAAFLIALIIQYIYIDGGWWTFALLLFAPDISMLGYIAGNKVGAFIYNLGHSFTLPILCSTIGYVTDHRWLHILGIIWLAHISLDRAAGYGLKDFDGFGHTHLGKIGKTKKSA